MLTVEKLLSFEKKDLLEAAAALSRDDIKLLAELLSEKDDTLRYHSLLLLQYRSEKSGDVYPYWDTFCEKLKSANSYQRSIGLMLIAANVKWDVENKIDYIIDEYFSLLHDEKPITVRQCIQSLKSIVPYKKHLHMKVAGRLMAVDITEVKTTMQKLVLTDILTVLALIRKQQSSDEIESYIFNVLSGGVLDKKAVKQVEAILMQA